MGSLPLHAPAITGRAGAATARRRSRARAHPRRAALLPGAGDGRGAGGPARRRGGPRRRRGAARRGRDPAFRRGSGGHKTIADLVRGLEARGPPRTAARRRGGPPRRRRRPLGIFRSSSGRSRARCASAPGPTAPTSWSPPAGRPCPRSCGCPAPAPAPTSSRTTSPSSTPTSIEREWAAWTYRQGLHAICASPWLAGVVRDDYGASASAFDLGVDHDELPAAADVERRADRVLFYARADDAAARRPAGRPRAAGAALAAAPASRSRSSARPGRCARRSRTAHLGVLAPAALAQRLRAGRPSAWCSR